jgi:hypothetical protein
LQSDHTRHDWQNWTGIKFFFFLPSSVHVGQNLGRGFTSTAQFPGSWSPWLPNRLHRWPERAKVRARILAKSKEQQQHLHLHLALIKIYKIWPPSSRPRNHSPLDPLARLHVSREHRGPFKDGISDSAETQPNQSQTQTNVRLTFFFFLVCLSAFPLLLKAPPDFLQEPSPRVVSRQSSVVSRQSSVVSRQSSVASRQSPVTSHPNPNPNPILQPSPWPKHKHTRKLVKTCQNLLTKFTLPNPLIIPTLRRLASRVLA